MCILCIVCVVCVTFCVVLLIKTDSKGIWYKLLYYEDRNHCNFQRNIGKS